MQDELTETDVTNAIDEAVTEVTIDTLSITPEVDDKGAIDISTIGIYTGGALLAILLIFIIVMIVEKCRKKKKRITEVVEFKPVDLDAHFKGVEERKIARSKALANRKANKPQKTPVPIMQPIHEVKDDAKEGQNSSRGASRYHTNEIDLSSKRGLREPDTARNIDLKKSPFM